MRYLLARLHGCAVVRGCAEESTGAGEIGCAEDWGYVRPVTDGESPVCAQRVTGSLLFGSPLRCVLGLPQPNLPSRGLSWTVFADFCFSCRLVWWKTMSSGVDLPAVDQAGAAPAATDPLPGTFLGPLDLLLWRVGRSVGRSVCLSTPVTRQPKFGFFFKIGGKILWENITRGFFRFYKILNLNKINFNLKKFESSFSQNLSNNFFLV